MGEYLPPPYGMLQLAAYLENQIKNVDIEVLDCQAMQLDWAKLEKRIESFNPDIVASSGFATCNAYVTARTLETARKINQNILTVTGGQHFTVTAQESLEAYPEIDVIVRGEGEQTLAELTKSFGETRGKPKLANIKGISFRHEKLIKHNPSRPLMENLDALPFPGYHFVKDYAHMYHFKMMAGPGAGYGMIEASRGCPHRCTFCSQWKHWQGVWRHKSIKRVVDEIEFLHNNYGSKLIWLTDDNFGFGKRMQELCDQLTARGFTDDLTTFMQARCDDVVQNKDLLPIMHKAGINYLLLGVESNSKFTLNSFRKGTDPEDSRQAVKLLKENGIFSQATCIVGERSDTAEKTHELREFINHLDPDIAIFMMLTPFPGTDLFEEAKRNGWIEDWNWANYDMIHAIMPTETLTREEVQQELYRCYRSFFGSLNRRIEGFFSNNQIKRRVYRYMAGQNVLRQLKSLI
jgi:anaerobic magnesium-protoporphyrin IX monomethyl ester cyclase